MVGLSKLWTDYCDVVIKEAVFNQDTKRTEFSEKVLHSKIPCRVSFYITRQTSGDFVFQNSQEVKLFLSNQINIPIGSKIKVNRNGKITDYIRSGEPAQYSTHQEIRLELFREWA